MRLALAEAKKGLGHTHPNPVVGSLIVKRSKVLATGFHARSGARHAEAMALEKLGFRATGATLYSTLEPCNHFGKTPPCTEAIVAAGIKMVVFASRDPNPLVNGAGHQALECHGLKVISGVLAAEADALNRPFFTFMRTGLPLVSLKVAMTLDGKIATTQGRSQWITGAEPRAWVHAWRNQVDALLTGIGTIEVDNPSLTSRISNGKNPARFIVDSNLSISLKSKVLNDGAAPTFVATLDSAPQRKRKHLESLGIEVWSFRGQGSQVPLRALLKKMASRGFLWVGVEGGARLVSSLLKYQLIDEMNLFLAPKIFGARGLTWSGLAFNVKDPNMAPLFRLESASMLGADVLLKVQRAEYDSKTDSPPKSK
jgi:diaminohydroxyphosphoribosylaminopyrimidine deaminase / 5-amino-6-(5-phosphoribosylamino)uracil reductase